MPRKLILEVAQIISDLNDDNMDAHRRIAELRRENSDQRAEHWKLEADAAALVKEKAELAKELEMAKTAKQVALNVADYQEKAGKEQNEKLVARIDQIDRMTLEIWELIEELTKIQKGERTTKAVRDLCSHVIPILHAIRQSKSLKMDASDKE